MKSKTLIKKMVIVIDNDETIRDVITIMLNNAQIDVIGHSDQDNAISWVSEHIGHANVAIIEHRKPIFDGVKCIKTLQAIDPGLKCILCSDTTDETLHINRKALFLIKPFLKNDLLKALNTAITENDRRI